MITPPTRRALTRRAAGLALLAAVAAGSLGPTVSAAARPDDPDPGTARARTAAWFTQVSRQGGVVPGSYVVGLAQTTASTLQASQTLSASAAAEATALGATVTHVFGHALAGYAARLTPDQAARLSADPKVAYVAPDVLSGPDADQLTPPSWGLDRVDQDDLPLDGKYRYDPHPGAGVTAFVVDSGIHAAHLDFGGRVRPGFTAVPDGRGTDDCSGHGTHVAGTIGGSGFGVAKGVNLVPVRVAGCDGFGSSSRIVAGVDWVVREKQAGRIPGPAVINMSMGHRVRWWEYNFPQEDALNRAIDAGIPVVISAGNDGSDACGHSPGRIERALTIGATTPSDARWPSSNRGSCVDLFAPGMGIRSASATSTTESRVLSGTSMAAPHVTGALARLIEEYGPDQPGVLGSSLKRQATAGRLSDLGAGSPNLLVRVARPRYALTPHVLGLSCAVASAEMRAAGLLPRCTGAGTWVSRQSVPPGATVPLGTAVTLTLRSGPIP